MFHHQNDDFSLIFCNFYARTTPGSIFCARATPGPEGGGGYRSPKYEFGIECKKNFRVRSNTSYKCTICCHDKTNISINDVK